MKKDGFRSGFVSFVGRPNTGKSSLTNALVGKKVAITSPKPQTTRNAIRGIVQSPKGQLVVVDTPGLHRPKTLLGQRLNSVTEKVLADVDVIALCVPADERVGPGDRRIVRELLKQPLARLLAIVTKTDLASKGAIAERLVEVDQLANWESLVPVSSVTGDQLEVLLGQLLALIPEGPPLYPSETVFDQTIEFHVAELIRESALAELKEEVPHSIAVTVDEIAQRADGLQKVFASLWVERASQKGIIIGKGGSRLREIGSKARTQIEELLGHKIYLAVQIKVAKEWQRDPKQINKLGL